MRRVGPVVGLGLAVALWTALLPTSLDGLWPWPPPEVGSTMGRVGQIVDWLLQPTIAYLCLVALAVWAGRRRLYRLAAHLVLSVVLTFSFTTLLKVTVRRARPDTPWLGALDAHASYPSAHSSALTTLALGVVVLAWVARFSRRRRLALAGAGAVLVLLVWADRLLLHVHHVTDVMAGSLVAGLAVATSWLLTSRWSSRLPAGGTGTATRRAERTRWARPSRRGEVAPIGPTYAVVANPARVRDLALLRRLVDGAAAARGWRGVGWCETSADDGGTAAARSAVDAGADVVLVAGGDGTLRAAVHGLLESAPRTKRRSRLDGPTDPSQEAEANPALAVVPFGSGDLLARNLRVPLDVRDAVALAFDGDPAPLDLLQVRAAGREEYALVMAGIGADAAVLADTREPLKRLLGAGAYLFAGVRHVRARPVHTSIAMDGAEPVWGYASLVGVGNVGELRPGVALMPGADAADGQLDVVAASPRHARDVLRMMAGTLVGSRREHGLDRYRGARVEVTTASPVPCHVDGDLIGEVTSLTAEVTPAALRVRTSFGSIRQPGH